jgi:hypothetical protein
VSEMLGHIGRLLGAWRGNTRTTPI